MFDELLKLVKENAGDSIINNPAIPNQHNDAAINTATSGIVDQLKKAMANGGASNLTSLFEGKDVNNNPIVNGINSNVANDLMKKFGIDASTANGIVQKLIPVVMSKFVKKTNDPNDSSFDLKGIIGSLTGGTTGTGSGIDRVDCVLE